MVIVAERFTWKRLGRVGRAALIFAGIAFIGLWALRQFEGEPTAAPDPTPFIGRVEFYDRSGELVASQRLEHGATLEVKDWPAGSVSCKFVRLRRFK